MTRKSDLKRLGEILQQRRAAITEAQVQSQSELRGLEEQERDPEYEEAAQTEAAEYTLAHLIENARRELILIDAALQRLADGDFGECVDCGEEISTARLMAIPFTLRCEEDARLREQQLATGRDMTPSL